MHDSCMHGEADAGAIRPIARVAQSKNCCTLAPKAKRTCSSGVGARSLGWIRTLARANITLFDGACYSQSHLGLG